MIAPRTPAHCALMSCTPAATMQSKHKGWIINHAAFVAQAAKEKLTSEEMHTAIDACRPLEHLRKVHDKNGENGVHKIAVISFGPQHGRRQRTPSSRPGTDGAHVARRNARARSDRACAPPPGTRLDGELDVTRIAVRLTMRVADALRGGGERHGEHSAAARRRCERRQDTATERTAGAAAAARRMT